MVGLVEIGSNLQTAIVVVGVAWALAFAVYCFTKYGAFILNNEDETKDDEQ